jgi:putative addiction module CopG family antidote
MMKTYQITLPDEFAAFVDRMIAERKWESADEVVMAALSRLMDEVDEVLDPDEIEWLKKEIQKGIDSADRGELAPLDMDAIRKRVEAQLASEKEPAHAPGDSDRAG